MVKFRLLPHMGDAFIEAYGSTLEEAFENAALAMFEVMTDTSKIDTSLDEVVEAEGFDRESLLYDWLENLIVKFEVNMHLYSRFKVESLMYKDGRYKLKARVWGESFDPNKHEQRVGVKAVTYHMMKVEKKNGKWVLRFLLDL